MLLTAVSSTLAALLAISIAQAPIGPPPPPEGAAPLYRPAALAELDPESAHGVALCRARDGDLEGAIRGLEDVVRRAPANELAARDLERVRAFAALRAAWLESVRASGQKVAFELDGKKLVAAVERVDGGKVYLKANARKLESIALAALDPGFVAREADKKEEQGGAAPWVRAFGFALVADTRFEKLLKDSAEDQALANDAGRAYPTLLRTGEAANALVALAGRAEPKDAAAALRCLDELTALCAKHADLPFLERRRAAIAPVAEAIAFRAFTLAQAKSLVHGVVGDFGTGDLKIVYAFDAPAELEDFEPADDFLQVWRKKTSEKGEAPSANLWEIADGNLRCAGALCYRYRLPFVAPMRIRVDYNIDSQGSSSKQTALYVALCAQGDSAYVLASPAGDLSGYDEQADYAESADMKGGGPFFLDANYELEIRHDGKTVRTLLDGDAQAEIPAGPRTRGSVYLWIHTNRTYSIRRLEIEGRVDPILLRAQWIASRLRAAGLK